MSLFKITLLVFFLLFLSCSGRAPTPLSTQGLTIKSPEGLYEFTLPSDWKEKPYPGEKIEKMLVAPDRLGGFFVLRVPNPPDSDIKEPQLTSYIEGLKIRYRNFQPLMQKVTEKYGRSIGLVEFSYDEDTPKGPLSIHNYCEVIIHKMNYFNVCGVAPASAWEQKKGKIFDIFSTWKLL
jgi:hypothetical protein